MSGPTAHGPGFDQRTGSGSDASRPQTRDRPRRCARAGAAAALDDAAFEDELLDGYAAALTADGWLAEADRMVVGLLDGPTLGPPARVLRELRAEQRVCRRELLGLRDGLEALRRERAGQRVRR